MEYCTRAFSNTTNNERLIEDFKTIEDSMIEKNNCRHNCDEQKIDEVCGIREDGDGYRIKEFTNKCEMANHNCENNAQYIKTDLFICKSAIENTDVNNQIDTIRNLVVVSGGMLGRSDNFNESIDNFFAGTHVFDLPVKEMDPHNTRRRLIKNAGPVKIFVPLIVIPKEKQNDTWHQPTLSTCYHKCPTKCPDTYAPVCGVAGIMAREPALMFKNHCFMDVAQCKMFWENKSSTSHSSSYIESSFLFCMGDEMNGLYRFLPAIRTLQRMGRLKKKGKFRVKLKNFRFVSEFRSGRPNFMG
ncbi:unnamed protein product [Leptosia nina]|uniref:Kazal-like domain-containing protein n=1 Tax=Leptosia nina TaxID=320188 RepID=A0AAV1JSB8_9NEOP